MPTIIFIGYIHYPRLLFENDVSEQYTVALFNVYTIRHQSRIETDTVRSKTTLKKFKNGYKNYIQKSKVIVSN